MTTVRYETQDGIATITLDRPETLNSMNSELMDGIRSAATEIENDDSVRVAILTGSGRGFCSGADLSGFDQSTDQSNSGEATVSGMDNHFNPAIRAVANLPVPSIAKVNGVAAGGGFGLAMTCDITIAARSAFFVATFGPRLGIVPDLGTTWHLPNRAGRARARGIAMLGGRITADEAKDWGLIWDTVDDDHLDDAVAKVAAQFAGSSPAAMTRIRDSLDQAELNTLSEQLDVERDHQRVLIPQNMAEGAAAFLEKREPRFNGNRSQG
ncbi:MAG: enoyl-CoA hydratase [Actinomycetia bacterium]|nr:enoyl-CoA hydratase [Actinomycetes bacterium]